MNQPHCPICATALTAGLTPWHTRCTQCQYERATLEPAINHTAAHDQIDESDRETGLRALRVGNFAALLHAMAEAGLTEGTLLDVGCAHGWFLEAAGTRFTALGIEPDDSVFRQTRQRLSNVRPGYFPDALARDERFNAIVFNDVFEHIPDVQATLAHCRQHLEPDGMLVLNLPSSGGIFYRIAKALQRIGVGTFFDRLWQKGLPSPHLHYFNRRNLSQFLGANGFTVVATGTLPTLRRAGLATRIAYTGTHSAPVRALLHGAILLGLPVLNHLPADIVYVIARKSHKQ